MGTNITQVPKWELHISSITKKKLRFYFLQQLEKFNQPKMIVRHYTTITEQIPITFITIFSAAATALDKGKLPCIIFSAEKIVSWNVGPPNLQDPKVWQVKLWANPSPSHHGQTLLESFPFSMRLPYNRTTTSLMENSFFPTVTGFIEKTRNPCWNWTFRSLFFSILRLHLTHLITFFDICVNMIL